MTYKDTTTEFNAIAESIKTKNVKSGLKKPKKTQEKNQFSSLAAQIGLEIAGTSEKLEKLTKLAKKRSLFEDHTSEIQDLTADINQDIKSINTQIASLQKISDSIKERTRNQQVENHADTIVKSLKTKLQRATKGFSDVLEIRTENLKAQQKEREHFTGTALSPNFAKRTESPLYRSPQSPIALETYNGSGEVAINMPQQSLVLTQDRYLASRAEAVVNIEKTISELQSIFRQLANLVAEQQEAIDRIDKDVGLTEAHVSTAQSQLAQYYDKLRNNRWLMIKIFFVLIFFMIIFVIFFV